jgi:hypothetical protein
VTTHTRRRLLGAGATALLATATGALSAGPANALPRDFDHVRYWNDVLIKAFRKTGDGTPSVLARATAMLDAAIHDTIVSLGGGTPYLGVVPRLAHASYDRDANIDAAAYRVLRSVLADVDFARDYAVARTYPVIGEPGPDGWSVSVGEGAADQALNWQGGDLALD